MRPTLISRTRRWLGASALALLVGVGGVSTAFVLNGQAVNAEVRNAAQILVPQVTQQQGFADRLAGRHGGGACHGHGTAPYERCPAFSAWSRSA